MVDAKTFDKLYERIEKYEGISDNMETVGMNGEVVDTCMGRTITPGQCIETSWFIMEEAKLRGWDKEITDMALQIFDWSCCGMEYGLDPSRSPSTS